MVLHLNLQEIITKTLGKINDYLHHWDLKSLGARQILSGYAAEFDDCVIFFDCGTSDDVNVTLLNFSLDNPIITHRANEIRVNSKIKY